MQFASTVVLALLTLLPKQANLTGTWVLDRVRSDFGAGDAPQRLILHLDEAGDRIEATMFMVGDKNQHVAYRECRIGVQFNGVLSCVTADGVSADEVWQVTARDELTITRVVNTHSLPVRQRLVLARSTLLE